MYRSNNNNDSDSTLRSLNEYNQLNNNNQQQDSVNSVDNNSAIISKYSPSPALSENANNLILRKRELLLNSKK